MSENKHSSVAKEYFYYHLDPYVSEAIVEGIDPDFFVKVSSNLVIPDYLEGFPVTEIAEEAFQGIIGVESVTLPKKLRVIGEWSFADTKLKKINIPTTVELIEGFAFFMCDIEEVTFFSKEEDISGLCEEFEIVPTAFNGNSLAKIKVGTENPFVKDEEGKGLYTKDGEEIVLGTTYGEIAQGTKRIGANAFKEKSLTNISLPETIVEIKEGAFGHNYITDINLPKNLKKIGGDAFSDNKIKRLHIPGSVTKVSEFSFANNTIEEVILEEGIEEIHQAAFAGNNIGELVIPQTIKYIGRLAFCDNLIQKIEIESKNLVVGAGAFLDNKIESVTLSEVDVAEIGANPVFGNNPIKKVFLKGLPKTPMFHFFSVYEGKTYYILDTINTEEMFASDKEVLQNNEVVALSCKDFENVKRIQELYI